MHEAGRLVDGLNPAGAETRAGSDLAVPAPSDHGVRLGAALRRAGRALRSERFLMALGWALRIGLIALVAPQIQTELYVPFLEAFFAEPSLDPWSAWLGAGGSADAFPYGVVMLTILAPFVFVGQLFDVATGGLLEPARFAQIGFAAALLFFDVWLFRSLKAMMSADAERQKRFGIIDYERRAIPVSRFLIVFYWLSPLILYVNYIHGQTDIIPTFIVIRSIMLLEARRFALSGVLLAAALSAKLSVGLLVPFLMIYVITHPAAIERRLQWFAAFAAGVAAIAASMWAIPGQLEIVMLNEALADTMRHGVSLPNDRTVLLFPLIYGAALAFVFFMAPLDRRSLYAMMALALISVVSVSSAEVGWYMWALPLLLYSSVNSSGRLLAMLFLFWLLVVIADWPKTACGPLAPLCGVLSSPLAQDLMTTAITGLALLISIRMVLRIARNNPAYRLLHRPVFVGVAGDSGAGKDTAIGALARLVGAHRSAVVLGDDYHLYARGARMWKALTHLNPRANNLHKMATDVENLARGKTVIMHHYDHSTGAFTEPRKIGPANLTMVNGLHALHQRGMAEIYDLKIFLRMDEALRRALKIARDAALRGKSRRETAESIEGRSADGALHIEPQAQRADLVCGLRPIDPAPGNAEAIVATCRDLNTDHRLCLEAEVAADVDLDPLAQALLAFGSVPVAVEEERGGCKKFVIYGADLSSDDLALLARKLLNSTLELLADQAQFLAGQQGVIQLLVLYLLEHKVSKGGANGS